MPNTESQTLLHTTGSDVLDALQSWADLVYRDLSRNRFAEEREWYEEALFYQRRQWLKWDNSNKRWSVVKQDPEKPRPMPVTNHFARTINAAANQLSSGLVRVIAVPHDDSDDNRRAGQYAEKAVPAIDEESGFRVLNPLLGKHTTLWGLGVTKDSYDFSASNGVEQVPQIEVQSSHQLGCLDCGNVADLGSGAEMSPDGMLSPAAPEAPGQQQLPCPQCGSTQTVGWQAQQPVVTKVKQFSRGRIVSEVRPIFEVFLPRDCQNPNLAKKIVQRYRKPLSVAKRLWGARAEDLKADEKTEIHEVYLEALRSLVNYNYMQDQASDAVTVQETWSDFDELPEELQDKVRAAVEAQDMGFDENEGDGDESEETSELARKDDEGGPGIEGGGEGTARPGSLRSTDSDLLEAPDGDLDPVDQLEQWGIFIISAGGKVLDWGINNLEGKKPFTFFLWEVDPANTYPKGLGVDLVPLQKRLNRLDSLMELGIMSNAAGKWLWPTTQTTKPPTGSPSDVIEFDPLGDGKIAPSFVVPTPFHQSCFALRSAILQDFMTLGMSNGIQQGTNPGGVDSFRGLAYLGAKGAEQLSTQRALWEMGHKLRYEKVLILARRYWTEGRKTKVAGWNGRYGMQELFGDELKGQYAVDIVPDSSRPQTLSEKESQLQMLLMAGLINPADPTTREYILDQVNLDNLNLTDHLQYMKAERDLDKAIAGGQPMLGPTVAIPIFQKIFSDYTLTEEFEALQPSAQMAIMNVLQELEQMQMAQMAAQMPPGPPGGPGGPAGGGRGPSPADKLAMALAAKNGGGGGAPLTGVPGLTNSPDASAAAADQEAGNVAAQLP